MMGFVKAYPWCSGCEITLPWNGNPNERCPRCNMLPRLGPRRSTGVAKDWSLVQPRLSVSTGPRKTRRRKETADDLVKLRIRLLELFGGKHDIL